MLKTTVMLAAVIAAVEFVSADRALTAERTLRICK
jgi:hypothetical protein